VPRNERGRRTDELLAALPGLLAGKPTDVGGRAVELAPGVTMPPILVGGAADAALVRTVRYGDGWFGLPLRREQLVPVLDRLGQLADDAGKPRPAVTGSVMVALEGDATVPDNAAIARILTDPDGLFGMPPEAVPGMLLRNAGELGERLAMWSELGAERVVRSAPATGSARRSWWPPPCSDAARRRRARAGAADRQRAQQQIPQDPRLEDPRRSIR
jgi:alkanesulfonate monooxygenase SsuD/methylene tetrahydromethanopterin reductase-like flavin-dependent oxidoreductase (luciferase family)